MKNTKKLLSTGVALAIALFTSVQMSAMEPGQKVNRYLKPNDLMTLESNIRVLNKEITENSDPASKEYQGMSWTRFNIAKAQLEACKKIYYGDMPFNAYLPRTSLTATNPYKAYDEKYIIVPSKPADYQ